MHIRLGCTILKLRDGTHPGILGPIRYDTVAKDIGGSELSAVHKHLYLLAILLGLFAPNIAAAQVWHGQIRCVAVPGVTTKPLVGDFEMSTNGSRLTYSRPVHKADLAAISGVAESGEGMLTRSAIKLQGGAAGKGYSYTAIYQGRIEDGYANLTGEQVWTTSSLSQPFHRACHITLTH